MSAVLVAGMVSYLASAEASPCAADPSGALVCAPQPTGEGLLTLLARTVLFPVWAPLLAFACVMGRGPSRGLAVVVAGSGILGGVVVAVLIVLLAQPSAPPSWDTPWLAFGLLVAVPGLVSALAAHDIGQRRRAAPATATTRARPHRWMEHTR